MQSTLTGAGLGSLGTNRALLDEAMRRLGEADRNAVVLRFFENKTAQEVATTLKLNEGAARKRVSRALEKLRKYFVQARGNAVGYGHSGRGGRELGCRPRGGPRSDRHGGGGKGAAIFGNNNNPCKRDSQDYDNRKTKNWQPVSCRNHASGRRNHGRVFEQRNRHRSGGGEILNKRRRNMPR